MQPTLSTARLRLRPFVVADAAAVTRYAGAREVAATTAHIPHPYLDGMATDWIGRHEAWWAAQEQAVFAIEAESEPVIGAIGLVIAGADRRAELGYWIGLPFWGRGYATEAARAVVAFGFEKLGLDRIHAIHFANNPASGRVLAKAGFAVEGRLRSHVVKWGVAHDVIACGMLRGDPRPPAIPDRGDPAARAHR
jgi:RimJ/RimL family protein N-acetyltransferase